MKHIWLTATVVGAIMLAACGGGSSKKSNATNQGLGALTGGASSTTTVDPFGRSTSNTLVPQGPAIGKIRIANLVSVNGQPGPAMDVYDTNRPSSTSAALIKNLAYGQVSDYVTPHGGSAGDVDSNLYAFPAGTLTTTQLLNGSNIDNSGFSAGDQLTIGLFPPLGGLDGVGSTTITEAGSRVPSGIDQAPPAGKGLLLVRSPASEPEDSPELYLVVNGSCPNPIESPTSNIPVTLGDARYPLAPGTYTLGVATSPRGQGLLTCKGKPTTGTTSVTIASGRRVDVFVYGDPKAPSIVTAPVSS